MLYLYLKLSHIMSSTILFGTGLGSAFYMWRANQSNNLQAMYFATKNVVIADTIFTTPAVIIQPISGFGLMYLLHYSINQWWILLAISLYVLTGLCWLPVVWLQYQMYKMLKQAIDSNDTNWTLPKRYYHYYHAWFFLGWPAFIAVVIIFYLMVTKPL